MSQINPPNYCEELMILKSYIYILVQAGYILYDGKDIHNTKALWKVHMGKGQSWEGGDCLESPLHCKCSPCHRLLLQNMAVSPAMFLGNLILKSSYKIQNRHSGPDHESSSYGMSLRDFHFVVWNSLGENLPNLFSSPVAWLAPHSPMLKKQQQIEITMWHCSSFTLC